MKIQSTLFISFFIVLTLLLLVQTVDSNNSIIDNVNAQEEPLKNITLLALSSESAQDEIISFIVDPHEGQAKGALTTTPVIGELPKEYNQYYVPGTEELDEDEIRLTFLGTGMPFPTRAQGSAALLAEFGNGETMFFDIGSGSIANFNSLGIPLNNATKVFASHLHTDHVGDLSMLWAEGMPFGRTTPLEVYGPSGDYQSLGTEAYVNNLLATQTWDYESRKGNVPTSGAKTIDVFEFDYNKTHVIYDKNGIQITSFPALHTIAGAVSFLINYNNMSFVYSGDTEPNKFMVENGQNVDVLIHETFLPSAVFAEKNNMPLSRAQTIVEEIHTPPKSAGMIFNLTEPKLGVMFHTQIDKDIPIPIFEELRTTYTGPALLAQDLTVINIIDDSIVVRQAQVENSAWPPESDANAPLDLPPHGLPEYLTNEK
ncbi:MAG: guanitoxin biosynthesis MBL fold metallo-hydrolase GntH, partial [Nitrososphaeraceae archaeon]